LREKMKKNEVNKIIKNELGAVMVQVLVVAAVLGVVSVALMKLQGGLIKEQKGVDVKNDADKVFLEMRTVLFRRAHCTATIQPLGITSGTGGQLAIPNILRADFIGGGAPEAVFTVNPGGANANLRYGQTSNVGGVNAGRFYINSMTAEVAAAPAQQLVITIQLMMFGNPGQEMNYYGPRTFQKSYFVDVNWNADGTFGSCEMDVGLNFNDNIVTNTCQMDAAVIAAGNEGQWLVAGDSVFNSSIVNTDGEFDCQHLIPPECEATPGSYFRGWRADGTPVCRQRGVDADFTTPWPGVPNTTHVMMSLNADGTFNVARYEGYCAGPLEVVKGWNAAGGLAGDGGFTCEDMSNILDFLPGSSTAGAEILVNDSTGTSRWRDLNCPVGWVLTGIDPNGNKICQPTITACGPGEYISRVQADGSINCELTPVGFGADALGAPNKPVIGVNPDGTWNFAAEWPDCHDTGNFLSYDTAIHNWTCRAPTPPTAEGYAEIVCPFLDGYQWNAGRTMCEKDFTAGRDLGGISRGYDGTDAGTIEVCDTGWTTVNTYANNLPEGLVVIMGNVTAKTDDDEAIDSIEFELRVGGIGRDRYQWYENARNPSGPGEESGHSWHADDNTLATVYYVGDNVATTVSIRARARVGSCARVENDVHWVVFGL
jgi:hypothetical protein